MTEDSSKKPAARGSMSSHLNSALDDHLKKIRASIERQATEFAAEVEGEEIGITHLNQAIDQYAPGKSFPLRKRSIFDLFTPVTIVATILTVVFAVSGLLAIKYGQSSGIDGMGFLDVAKIFAGAIVGSTTATATNRKK